MSTYCDNQYTFTPKPVTTGDIISKPSVSYTLVSKPVVSVEILEKPSVSYTVIGKATRPSTTVVPEPCLELLSILTESGIEILYEDTRVMVREG